jgi:hypothetical protein
MIELGIGQVLASLPQLNSYQVSVRGGGKHPGIAVGSGSERLSGHRSNPSYLPGAYVLVALVRDYSGARPTDPLPVLILGAFAPVAQVAFEAADDAEALKLDQGMQRAGGLQNNALAGFPRNNALAHLLTFDQQQLLSQDRSFGRLSDAGPGDWYQNNPLGGMFYLSDFLARMAASPQCGIAAHFLDDLLELQFRNLSFDGETYRQEWLDRGNTTLGVQGLAFDALEGMGGFQGIPALTVDDADTLAAVAVTQAPVWRMLNLSGGDVEGLWSVTRAPLLQDTVCTRTSEYYGLGSEQRRFDGIYRVQAAKEIRFEKTLEIKVPEELKDVRTQPRDGELPPLPEQELWQQLGYASEDELRVVSDLVFRQQADWDELQVFGRGLRQDEATGIWRLPTAAERDRRLQGLIGAEIGLRQLEPTEQEYLLDDVVSGEVEVYPGRKIRLFRNSSVFMLLEDGGFTLEDGWGGGIRCNRGVLELFSAADIRLRPGRDIITMAPGNIIQKAGNYVETTSTAGSIVQKAEKNLHLLSGNGGEGSTILENRATAHSFQEVGADKRASDEALGSGIVLKSPEGGIALLGNRMYVGGAVTDDSKSRSGTAASMDIVIDAGAAGTVAISGGNVAVLARDGLSMSLSSALCGVFMNSSSLLAVNPGSIGLVSSTVYFDEVDGTLTVPVFAQRKLTQKKVSAKIGPPLVVSRGNISAAGTLEVAKKVTTIEVNSRDGINGQLGVTGNSRSLFDIKVPPSRNQTWAASLAAQLAWMPGVYTAAVDSGHATDFGQKMAQVKYPDSASAAYRAGADWHLYSLRWQLLCANLEHWEENPVVDAIVNADRYPYPGTQVYARKAEDGPYRPVAADGSKALPQRFVEYPINCQLET